MASRKRGLSDVQIYSMLDESDDSLSDLDSDDSEVSFNSSRLDVRENDKADDREELVKSGSSSPFAFAWSRDEIGMRQRLAFIGTPGRRVPVEDTSDPMEYFNLFLTDDILDKIVTGTNRRAHQLMQSDTLKNRSRLNSWIDVSRDELKVFLSSLIY